MDKDIQKPILFKADPWNYAQIERQKEIQGGALNRNRFINEAVNLYLELVTLMQQPQYGYINEVSFNDAHLQRILYERLRRISIINRPAHTHGR